MFNFYMVNVILFTLEKTVTYNIDVKTGNVSGAGTDANVFINIYGTKKNTGKDLA